MTDDVSQQLKDFMSLYQNLVERCFTTCCNDFTSKALSTKEVCLVVPFFPFLALSSHFDEQRELSSFVLLPFQST